MDNSAPVYDDSEAVDFIVTRTGAAAEDVQRFLGAKMRYEILIGTFPVLEENKEQLGKEKELHADLHPREESKVPPLTALSTDV